VKNDQNQQVILTSRPQDIPQAENFELRDGQRRDPADGEILVRNHYLSVDPAMRGWVSDVPNYSEPVGLGDVMRSIAIGEIIESRHPDYAVGEYVSGLFGWQEYAVTDGSDISYRVDPADGPLSASLGILGINGITAYFGLLDVGQPKPGDTVVVSTAAGAVGSAVGQIAKIKGCKTVGITGSDEKVERCRTAYGYDNALNYKDPDWRAKLAEYCPDGVDVYYDNTAGVISDEVHSNLTVGARVVICGTASVSSWTDWPQGPRIERHLLVKRARMQGFVIFDYADRYAEARSELAQWIRDGVLSYDEDILDGLEHAPGAIARLYAGANTGKLLIRVSDDA